MSNSQQSGSEPKLRTAVATVFERTMERVANTYAEAALRAAAQKNQVDVIVEEFEDLVNEIFNKQPQLEELFTSGAISRDAKQQLIEKTFGPRASELFVNTLLVLNKHERLAVIRPMACIMRQNRDRHAGLMRVSVHSAVPMSTDQSERLKNRLRDRLHREPVLEMHTDASLLGGMVVQIGDVLYDHSVRAELIKIRNQILSRSSHEIQSGRDRFSITD